MTEPPAIPRPGNSGIKYRRLTDPFYPITWQQALQDYQDGILTPRGLIYCYFVIHLRPGSETPVNVTHLCTLLQLHEATYYRAIGALKAKGRLNLRRGQMTIGIPEIPSLSAQSQSCDSTSQHCDSNSQDCDPTSQPSDSTSQSCENQNYLNPLSGNASRSPANVPETREIFKQKQIGTPTPTHHPVFSDIDKAGIGHLDSLLQQLCHQIDRDTGIIPNQAIQQSLKQLIHQKSSAAAQKAVENAISSLKEQQAKRHIHNPGGFLNAALRRQFTANHTKRHPRDRYPSSSSSPPSPPSLSPSPSPTATDLFPHPHDPPPAADLSDLIAHIQIHLDRLHWTKDQAIAHMVQHHRWRPLPFHRLLDADLTDLLIQLQQLPAPCSPNTSP